MAKFNNEAELAQAASKFLLADGWDCYFEVCRDGYGNIADIVAVRGPYTAIIETKMSLSMTLMAQCHDWVRQGAANFVVAAVPAKTRNPKRPFEPSVSKGRGFALRVAKDYGFGVWQVPSEEKLWGSKSMRDMGMTSFHRFKKSSSIRDFLKEEMKTQAMPGTRVGGYVTPFTITCDRVRSMLRNSDGESLVSDVIRSIEHHYASNKSARGSLVSLAKSSLIPGIGIRGSGRESKFFLKEE